MEEQILIHGKNHTKRNGFRYLWPGCCLWAMVLLYAAVLYGMNVKECHYAWTADSCFLKWEYSFWEFLKLSVGTETFFVSLTVLLWSAVFCLIAGILLYFAFRNNEITVTNIRIYGKSAFGHSIQFPIASLTGAKGCPGHSIKLNLLSHSVLFGGMQNKKEILDVLEKSVQQQTNAENIPETPDTIHLESQTDKLGRFYFLPLFLFVILLTIGLAQNAEFCQEVYQGLSSIPEKYAYWEYLLLYTLKNDLGLWIKCFFFLSLVGICGFFAYRSSKLTLHDGRILGKCKWGRPLDINVNSIKGVSMGSFGKLTLYTDSKKFVFGHLKRADAFYGYFTDKFGKIFKI